MNRPEYSNSAEQLDRLAERLLVLRTQSGDRNAFHDLVTRYERRLTYYIRRMTGDGSDAFDILQEVWLRVYQRIGTLRAPEACRTWLYRIAHDRCVDQLGSRAKEPAQIDETLEVETDDDPGDVAELLENASRVHTALAELAHPHREVLTLRFLEDLPLLEIAEIVGCSTGTVKSRLHYAKLSLRQVIERKSDG
jgi:RNA polymerase sigma-70 factor (ECF subfamily)